MGGYFLIQNRQAAHRAAPKAKTPSIFQDSHIYMLAVTEKRQLIYQFFDNLQYIDYICKKKTLNNSIMATTYTTTKETTVLKINPNATGDSNTSLVSRVLPAGTKVEIVKEGFSQTSWSKTPILFLDS